MPLTNTNFDNETLQKQLEREIELLEKHLKQFPPTLFIHSFYRLRFIQEFVRIFISLPHGRLQKRINTGILLPFKSFLFRTLFDMDREQI